MKNIISELFLSEYFLFRAVLGKYLGFGRQLFYGLGETYFLTGNKLDGLYNLAVCGEVENVSSGEDFMRYRRIKKFSELTGLEIGKDTRYEEILNIKGNALAVAGNFNIRADEELSQSGLYANLSAAANSGLVHALRILGVLQCEGIFVDKNIRAGIKNLSKAADWNDKASLLALLAYCPDTRAYNLSRLYTAVKDTPYETVYAAAAKSYGTDACDRVKEVKLLEKAFVSGVLKRDCYDPKYARIIYCKALHFKDKEKVIFTDNKELLSVIADLPLKLSDGRSVNADLSALGDVRLIREKEQELILRNFRNSDLRGFGFYRPLCLCSDSVYLLNMYAEAFARKAADVHTERIDVAELTEYDLEPNPSNVFVRNADEDKDNRYLLFFCGDIPERTASYAKVFLQSARRSKFHLNNPCITLDLSGVLPVCFCDKANLKYVKPYCDVLQLDDVSAEEMPAAVRGMLAEKKAVYRLAEVDLCGDMCDFFKNYDVDTVESIVDDAIRSYGVKGGRLILSRETVIPFVAGNVGGKIGFGGADK